MENTDKASEIILSLITILLGMSLFSSFFNSVHSEARIWMQNYVRRYNRTQTAHWMSQGRTSEYIKTELQRKNHRQWATFNGYYSVVKTITFLVLFALICFTICGYHRWGVEFSNYPKYWLSIYVYGILGTLLLQSFGMFFALFDFTSRIIATLYKLWVNIKSALLDLWRD